MLSIFYIFEKKTFMSSTEYESLPADLKKEIILNSEQNKSLKIGFYSKSYIIQYNGKTYKYRFHCISHYKNKNHHTIIFNGKTPPHKNKILENDNILFFDNELECSLKITKDVFEQELVDMNLSPEQKASLAKGEEITLNISKKNSLSNGNALTASYRARSFCADYNYFLGSNTLFIKENKVLKNTHHKI